MATIFHNGRYTHFFFRTFAVSDPAVDTSTFPTTRIGPFKNTETEIDGCLTSNPNYSCFPAVGTTISARRLSDRVPVNYNSNLQSFDGAGQVDSHNGRFTKSTRFQFGVSTGNEFPRSCDDCSVPFLLCTTVTAVGSQAEATTGE